MKGAPDGARERAVTPTVTRIVVLGVGGGRWIWATSGGAERSLLVVFRG